MINITQSQIEMWVQKGAQASIDNALRDTYGAGKEIKVMMDRALKESEPHIVKALKDGIMKAAVSPAFMATLEQEIARSLANQYRGAFEGVMRHAAKMAASNEIIARRVAELTQQAALGGKNED